LNLALSSALSSPTKLFSRPIHPLQRANPLPNRSRRLSGKAQACLDAISAGGHNVVRLIPAFDISPSDLLAMLENSEAGHRSASIAYWGMLRDAESDVCFAREASCYACFMAELAPYRLRKSARRHNDINNFSVRSEAFFLYEQQLARVEFLIEKMEMYLVEGARKRLADDRHRFQECVARQDCG
jgi:hypothetical protein